MFKRAFLSVKRRTTKTIISLLFLFIISTLVLSTISIKNATKKSMDVARKSLSTEVTLSMDMSKLKDTFKNDDNTSSEEKKEKMNEMHIKMNENSARISDVNKLKDSKYVCDVKYSFDVQGEEESFSLYSENSENNNDSNLPQMDRGPRNNSLQIEAINTFKLLEEYREKTITLESGEAFDENDENIAIISYELATTNNLKVGNTIKIKDSSNNSHELTVVGIYQNSESMGFNNNYNKIYVNTTTGEKFMTEDEYNAGNYSIKSAVFYINDPDNSEKFIKESKKLITNLEDRNLKLDIDTQTYKQMTASIKNVSNLTNIILIVVIVAAIVVITLMTINSLKDRNYELGVLLSLGEKKSKIVSQFILELFLIATCSFILAIGSSKLISQKLANTIINTQNQTNEKMLEGPGADRGNGMKVIKNSSIKEINDIDVDVDIKNICYLFIIGYGIIIISNIIPSIKIINSDPKDILSRKE